MRNLFNFLFIFVVFAMSPLLFAESDEESGHEDQKSYLLFDHIYLYSDKSERWGTDPKSYINSIFPALSSDDGDDEIVDNFNTLITDFVQSERMAFQEEIKKNNDAQKTLPLKLRKNNFYLDYASAFVRSKKIKVLSIRFIIQRYIGGMAHPSLAHYSINYDLTTGKALELESLFKPDSDYLVVLSGIVSDSLAKKLKTNFDKEGVKPHLDTFAIWNIRSEGILFTFDEGRVAPRVYGAQTVLVPYRSIPGLLSEDTIVSHCANKKSRCLASNLLTGGFLDEVTVSAATPKNSNASLIL